MANVIMQTSNLSEAMRVIYSALLIQAAAPALIFNQACEPWSEPGTEHGQQVYRTIYKKHKATPGELPETTDPDSTPMSAYQVNVTVREHGDAIQLSEKLRRLTYQPVVAQRVAEVGWGMGITVDTLAKYAFMSGAQVSYGGSKTSRAALVAGNTITSAIVRQAVRNLNRRNAIPWGGPGAGGFWLAFIHPDLHFDMTADSNWLDPHKYVDTYALYRNELGMWYKTRFIESTLAVLPNAGTKSVDTTLGADVAKLATTFTVASATGISAGDVLTITSGTPGTVDITAGAFDAEAEEVEVGSIAGTTITLASDQFFQFAHTSGDAVYLGVDIHPYIVCGPGAVAQAYALLPELRVQRPIDKLQRLNSVGWYSIIGYGVARDWQLERFELSASA